MASKVQIVLVDDLDGGPAESTVLFALDGSEYEIDLSDANAEGLREALQPYIEAGRKVSGRNRKRTKAAARAASSNGNRSAEIRAWAAAHGISVNSRGRIPADIAAQYDAAQR